MICPECGSSVQEEHRLVFLGSRRQVQICNNVWHDQENVAWVKSVLQDCCRNKDISRETAKEIVAALLRDTGGIDFDHAAAVTPEEKRAEEFAAALLLRIAEELDEYGSERAAQHLRRHAAKLKEESGD